VGKYAWERDDTAILFPVRCQCSSSSSTLVLVAIGLVIAVPVLVLVIRSKFLEVTLGMRNLVVSSNVGEDLIDR